MLGSICTCGFKTISIKESCPRCGRIMTRKEFPDYGKVLSYVKLGVLPEGLQTAMNLAMVEIVDGPQLPCWTTSQLSIGEYVKVFLEDESFRCEPT